MEQLNEKETYWIRKLDAINQGYNCNEGGNTGVQGATNPNAKVTEEDVEYIRDMYAAHVRKKEVYERVKSKITWNSFEGIFEGRTWKHVKPEVLTDENKQYYATQATNGENSSTAKFTNEEVLKLRNEYVSHTAKELYTEEYQKRIAYQGFQRILSGETYKELPFYSKKHKQWFYDGERPAPMGNRGKVNYQRGFFTDEEVLQYRTDYIDMTAKEVYAKYPEVHDAVSFGAFQKMLTGKMYSHLKHYSKKTQQWVE